MYVLLNKAIMLALALLIGGVLLGVAFQEIANANTTAWNHTTITLYLVVIPIVGSVAFAIYLLGEVRVKRES